MNHWLNSFTNSKGFQQFLHYSGMGRFNAKIVALVTILLFLFLIAGTGVLLAQNGGKGSGNGGSNSEGSGGGKGPNKPKPEDFFQPYIPLGHHFNGGNFRGGDDGGYPFYSPGGGYSLGGGSGTGNETIIQNIVVPINTPEPISSALFLLGGAAFGIRSLRKRK